MRAKLSFDVLPIFRRGGFPLPEHPGLHLALPPRRTPRTRANDLLVIYLELQGNAPISPKQQTQLLNGVTQTFYQTRGSLTAAMMTAVDRLNQYLLDRNLRNAENGLQTLALLAIIAARGDRVFLGQSGPMHAFIANEAESQHLHDTQIAGRGLGTSRKTHLRISQVEVAPNGLILVSPAPPPTWSATTFRGSHKVRLERLHHNLLSKSGPDLSAVLLKIQPGSGELHLLQQAIPQPTRPSSSPTSPLPTRSDPAPEAPFPETLPQTPVPAIPFERQIPESEEITLPAPVPFERPQPRVVEQAVETSPRPVPRPVPIPPPASPVRQGLSSTTSGSQVGSGTSRLRARPAGAALGSLLLNLNLAVGRALDSTLFGLRAALGRMTPGDSLFSLPSSVMAGIAISVPLIVVTIASVVYFQRGLDAQHLKYLNQAQAIASQVPELENPSDLRLVWGSTLEMLDVAETYEISENSQALRGEAQLALDQLDGVTRLNLQSALTGRLGDEVEIIRMVSTDEGLYMLNKTTGSVFRAFLTGRGYEFEPTFQCGPGAYGSLIVGPLIDIAALPKGNDFNATILAMDSNGNLIYCIPDKSPIASPLVPPDSNWGNPVAITLDSGNLYILDPQTNAVWIYRGTNGTFGDRPSLFFADQVPKMQDVMDLAVNRADLYLVHADGHLTTCTFSNVAASPTRCEDPATFIDARPGMQAGAVIPDTQFTQIQFTPPPDPSIYLLDPDTQSIYHFSLRLTLQRQFRSQEQLPDGPATAFSISPTRSIFLAIHDEVFFAALP